MLSFFPRGVLDEILNLIESVSEGFPSYSALNNFVDRWCKREHFKPHALKACKVRIFKIKDKHIKFNLQNTNLLHPKLTSSFLHIQRGI